MNKGATYSLLAMGVLLIASLGLGVYAKLADNVLGVSADVELQGLPLYETPCRVQPVPLKMGVNRFLNDGISFSLEDRVLLVNRELVSFIEAQKRDIIGSVSNITKNRNLEEGVLGVAIGEEFSLDVRDTSLVPQLCLRGIK